MSNCQYVIGTENWRKQQNGPRGGESVPMPWRHYGEGACFLIRLVESLISRKSLAIGTMIVADRQFSSIKLARWVLNKGMRYLGAAIIRKPKANAVGVDDDGGTTIIGSGGPNAYPEIGNINDPNLERGTFTWRQALYNEGSIAFGFWVDTITIGFLTVNVPWSAAATVLRRLWIGTNKKTRNRSATKQPVKCTIVQDYYNKWMGSVDAYIREAHRTYSSTERRQRLWKKIVHMLFDMAVYTSFCLYMWTSYNKPSLHYAKLSHGAQKKYRITLADELTNFKAACPSKQAKKRPAPNDHQAFNDIAIDAILEHQHIHHSKVPGGRSSECVACRNAKKGCHNAKHTAWMCKSCKVNLCKGVCWEQYHKELFGRNDEGS